LKTSYSFERVLANHC